MVETPTALVIGASGLVGASIAQHLKAAGWKVHAHMGRSFLAGGDSTNDCFAADLLDADSTRRAIQNIEDIHQVFYCARLTAQNLEIEGRQNISAFNNVLDALASCQNLRRILLIEGTKWYGSNRGRYLVPALETDRADQPFYYHHQQDSLEQHCMQKAWRWTSLRPHTVISGHAKLGHNFLRQLAYYAAMAAASGEQLSFPGSEGRYSLPTVFTDVDLLARSAIWAATAIQAENQAFNVNDGELLWWPDLWPRICEFFQRQVGPIKTQRLEFTMPALADKWQTLGAAKSLLGTPWPDAKSWAFADGIFHPARVDIISTAKITLAGFSERRNSGDAFISFLSNLRAQKVLP